MKKKWIRYTAIMRSDDVEAIKALSWWYRKPIKDILDEVLTPYLKNKKKELKEAKDLIKKRKMNVKSYKG